MAKNEKLKFQRAINIVIGHWRSGTANQEITLSRLEGIELCVKEEMNSIRSTKARAESPLNDVVQEIEEWRIRIS